MPTSAAGLLSATMAFARGVPTIARTQSPSESEYSYQPLGSSKPQSPPSGSVSSVLTAALIFVVSLVRFRSYRKTLAALVTATLTVVAFIAITTGLLPSVLELAVPITRPAPALTLATVRASMSKDEYVDAVVQNPIEGVLDPAPIRQLCDSIRFQEGLVWQCEPIDGGIGNVGNMWLNCMRYAIEAGATTVILPRSGARDQHNLADLGGGERSIGLDAFYDLDYFFAHWADACPQLHAVLDQHSVPGLASLDASVSLPLKPNAFAGLPRNHELIINATGWRSAFDAWLADMTPANLSRSVATPVLVRQSLALSHWNRQAHDHAFAVAFPRLFRFPDHIRRLAAAALWRLEQRSGGRSMVADAILFPDLTPAAWSNELPALATALGPNRLVLPSTSSGSGAVDGAGFLGVHLRVAEDAAEAHWPGYEAQAPAYLEEAVRTNLSTIFLATGSDAHRERFRADAASVTMTAPLDVVTKEDLLDETELATLNSLFWDQKAIVDFEVLLHSSRFAGFVRSSFSWVVAIRRSSLPDAGEATVTRRRQHHHDNTEPIEVKFRDALSVVLGRYDAMTIEGIWP